MRTMTALCGGRGKNVYAPACRIDGTGERNLSEGEMVIKIFQTYWQQFAINSQGTLRISKLGEWVQRGTNTIVLVDGAVQ